MKAHILMNRGQITLIDPIEIKDDAPVRLQIEVPDEFIAPARDWFMEEAEDYVADMVPKAPEGSFQEELNLILGEYARVRPFASIGDDHQALMEALEERYLGR